MSRCAYYAVDRIEGTIAVLVGDAGDQVELPRAGLREGYVLCWDGRRLRRDRAEEKRRLRSARAQLEQLKRSDPGGNIRL